MCVRIYINFSDKPNEIIMISLRICLLFAIQLIVIKEAVGNPDAKRLYDDLLSNYNRLIRPVSNHTQTVLVKLGLRLSQLIDLVRFCVIISTVL